ncbi:pilus assembly FimT family protein, partial [Nitratifractor sp.]
QQRFWRIYFGTCEGGPFYAIGTDDNMESSSNARVDFNESAIDPANGKRFWAKDGSNCAGSHNRNDLSPSVFLGKKYGISSVTASGGCSNNYLGFDHYGRPYNSSFPTSTSADNAGAVVSQDCNFTFQFSDGSIAPFSIIITKETGYAYIDGQSGS